MEQELKWEEERIFHVKDIPLSYDEWKIFHIFHKYGLVSNVRICGANKRRTSNYGFVSMVVYEGSDALRNALVRGVLKTDTVQLRVENMLGVGQDRARPSHSNNSNRYTRRPVVPVPIFEKPAVKLAVKIPPGVVPSAGAHTAFFVDPPSTIPKERFAFYVKLENSDKNPQFLRMKDAMKQWVEATPKSAISGERCMIVRVDGELHRGYITLPANAESGDKPSRAYLMDEGREVEVTEAWPMSSDIAGVAARVCECDLAGLKLKPGVTLERYEAMRSLLKVVSVRARLIVSLVRFVKGVNMVNARSIYTHPSGAIEDSDIVQGFVAKSKDFDFIAEEASKLEYEREAIITMRETCKMVEEGLARKLEQLQVTREFTRQ